jgi:hypothetical protein
MNLKEIKLYLLEAYLYGAILLSILFIILKCYYKITYFDKYLYLSNDSKDSEDSEKKMENLLYYIGFHVIFYFILGLIFQFDKLLMQILQTIFVEFAFVFAENCTFENMNYESAIISIIIGMTSYIFAGFLMKLIKYFREKK